MNLPLGVAAAWVFRRRFEENVARRRHRIDYLGSSLLALGGTVLPLALLEGGVEWAWDSAISLALFGAAGILLVGFVLVERMAAEPVLPLWIFRMRVLNVTNAGSLVVGVLLMGLSSYVPLYAQRVLGTGALVAGLALAAMTIGWPIAAATAGRLYLSVGFRATLSIGAFFSVVGALILLSVNAELRLVSRVRLLRDGTRLRVRREPRRGRRPDGRVVVESRRRDECEHVLPLGRQRRRGRHVRRGGQQLREQPLREQRPEHRTPVRRDPRARDQRRVPGDGVHHPAPLVAAFLMPTRVVEAVEPAVAEPGPVT